MILFLVMKIGFIGQGWIGKNIADDYENRGYEVVRYALEEPYANNKSLIKDCEIVVIAVPTPTTPDGFDDSILHAVIPLTGNDKIVVVKSTVVPGVTESLAKTFPDRYIIHSPEFLVESTAAYDAAHPTRNILGIPDDTEEYKQAANKVLSVLPDSPVNIVCSAREAELIKYASNCFLFTKVIFANILFDLTIANSSSWEIVAQGMAADPRIGTSHLKVIDASRHPGAKAGRGAGGHCFIKDFAALREIYEKTLPGNKGLSVLRALEEMNIELLEKSGKDLDLLKQVYEKTPLNQNL